MYDDFSNINGGSNPHFTVLKVKHQADESADGANTRDEVAKASKEIKDKEAAKEKKESGVPGPA